MSQLDPTHSIGVPVAPSRSRLQPLGIHQVTISEGFWAKKQQINKEASIPHCLQWDKKLGWIGNFGLAATKEKPEDRAGREFSDSEVYKLLEAMIWETARHGNPSIDKEIQSLGALISSAQDEDGYLNTHYGQKGQTPRYTDFEWGHELYCYGHLFQAAAARVRTGHNDEIVSVAKRVAAHLLDIFGRGKKEAICGHPEIEVGLAEFGRAIDSEELIDLAQVFLERRGHGILAPIEWGQEYFQDDIPVREASVFRGHAVRAGYLAAGALDIAVETGDQELLAAIQAQYDRTLERRTYITGGVGSRHTGEAFGEDFELPCDRAYCETCAAISSVMVAWRLLLATGEERYADAIERCLFNAIACSPSQEGTSFFYANPLHLRKPGAAPQGDQPCLRAETGRRAPWFTVSCCPPNVARLFASLSGYLASVDDRRVRIHQFATGEIHATTAEGEIHLLVHTNYPEDGRIEVTVVDCDPGVDSVALRIPSWAEVKLTGLEPRGDLAVSVGTLAPGSRFVMEIDMAPRFTHPDPRIDAVRGCVAVERGPLVLCLESDPDTIESFRIDTTMTPMYSDEVTRVAGYRCDFPEDPLPYAMMRDGVQRKKTEMNLIAYHSWANHDPMAMRVWIPTIDSVIP